MKKIYIAGCGGMLGKAFYYKFRDECELRCTDIDVNEYSPDWLFHLGAYKLSYQIIC